MLTNAVRASTAAHRPATETVAVCVPARNEASTIGNVVRVVRDLRQLGIVEEVVVIDDGSTDATGAVAAAMGASVVACVGGPGKGQALRTAVEATDADILVFLDADVANFAPHFVTQLIAPFHDDPTVQLVKAAYRRPLDGRADEGGRVTELLARPLLRRFFPELADVVRQPLAGECAVRRHALDEIRLEDGYGIEIGLLIDIYRRFGPAALAQADLGERVHRNRPLRDLRPHCDDVLGAVLARTLEPTGVSP